MKAVLAALVLQFGSWVAVPSAYSLGGDTEFFFVLTQSNELVSSVSWAPEAAGVPAPVTGLGTYDLVGIDVRTTVRATRPANPGVGTIWALGVDGAKTRVFVIDRFSKAATPVGPVLAGIDGTGSDDNGWFFGHHPGTDRFHIINSTGNYELDPNTMAVTPRTNLAGALDLNGSSFETASFGLPSRIYFVDQSAGDPLRFSANIATGQYLTAGGTGLDFSLGAGLEIVGATTYLAATVGGTAGLYRVNRSNGAATLLGAIGTNPTIRALTMLPPTYPPQLPVNLKVNGERRLSTSRPLVTIRGRASCEAGIKQVEFRVGDGRFRKAFGTTRWAARIRLKPGRNLVTIRATGNTLAHSSPERVSILREVPRFVALAK